MTHMPTTNLRSRRGFTIVELLVSIAIIFILIASAAYALRTANRNARRVETLGALRQMVTAYNNYTSENKGKLMPGYIDAADFGTNPGQFNIRTRLESGFDLPDADAGSYVWRLAPFLDHSWKAFLTDYRSAGLETRFVDEYGSGDASGTFSNIAVNPAYGLNSLFLGGDSSHAGLGGLAPWKVSAGLKPLAASRLSEVKSPPKIVVFAPTAWRTSNGTTDVMEPGTLSITGYCELRAPMWHEGAGINDPNGTGIPQQWSINTTDNRVNLMTGEPAGVPVDRLGDNKIPVAHLDGSTDSEFIERLANDMSRWSPFVVSQN